MVVYTSIFLIELQISIGAVSYTHLDVYKRQLQCVMWEGEHQGSCFFEIPSPFPLSRSVSGVVSEAKTERSHSYTCDTGRGKLEELSLIHI